ncbi:M20/M25/M40 family metallo-hydrolase [Dehalobacter restrictus]|uniref:M20/M25/M40 family metallo-hydrolase n=1 Tax=Dehalobacter restrictus TaxID=55583 RepID=UPI00056DCC86|nr:M20/M25/M40 family metallo-hydrolase [Dehalobacter restrictus]
MHVLRNSFELARELTCSLTEMTGVSGYEQGLKTTLQDIFAPLSTETFSDFIGNFYAVKKGEHSGKHSVMLAAHIDEIGLMITHIDERGFLHFATLGGIDQRTLLYQEILVHGKGDLRGIVCLGSSHKDSKKRQTLDIEDLVIDIGLNDAAAAQMVKPGDIASIKRGPLQLLNDRISGKALDDRAGVAVLAVCLNELMGMKHQHDVVAVATVQEEVGLRGGLTSSERLLPSLAVAVDVTHAQTLDTKSQVSAELAKGPVISLGPNIHPWVYARLSDSAQQNRIVCQRQAVPGATGTDARVIQLTGYGIPTGLVSIPLRYMHTSVETASLQDIVECGKLLAYFIASLPEELEEI